MHWVCPERTPYHDFFFGELSGDPDVILTVHYLNAYLDIHPWEDLGVARYRSRICSRSAWIDWSLVRLALCRYNKFVIAGWHTPSLIILLLTLVLLHRNFVIWTDTPAVQHYRSPLKAYFRRVFLKLVFLNASRVMSTGEPGVEALQQMGCPKQKTVVFPFFVRLDSTRASDSAKKSDQCVRFVSSGRLVNRLKGYDLALRAIAQAKNSVGDRHFEYHIAGAGVDEKELKKLALDLGVSDQTHFRGWLGPQAMLQLLLDADIFVHPALDDPFPVAVLEAMAAGAVVLGSDACGSVRDRIKHGVNGFIHAAGNIQELADQVAYLLRHPEVMKDIGTLARRTAEEWPASRGISIIKSLFSNNSSTNRGVH